MASQQHQPQNILVIAANGKTGRRVARQLESRGESEVTASEIGERVMEALKGLDDVAYVRFASVYRNFSEARDFEAFVTELAQSVGKGGAHEGEDD